MATFDAIYFVVIFTTLFVALIATLFVVISTTLQFNRIINLYSLSIKKFY